MDEAKRVAKFMAHSCTELEIGHVISHPTVVHGWLILADCMATGANVRPVAISVKGDTDVGFSWGVALHPFEGYVRIASPFVGKLIQISICTRSSDRNHCVNTCMTLLRTKSLCLLRAL